jgi:hypothetical protein
LAAPDRPTGGHDDPRRVRDDRVPELDLDADDRPEARCFGCAGEPDDPVQALVIGDRQPREPELDRAFDEVIGR